MSNELIIITDSTYLHFVKQILSNYLLHSGKSGPKDQVALHYYYTSPSH